MTETTLNQALGEYKAVLSADEVVPLPDLFRRFGIPLEHAEAAAEFAAWMVKLERLRCEALCIREARNSAASAGWRNAATVILTMVRCGEEVPDA